MDKILVIGASGQLGSELTLALRDIYGEDEVIASDIHAPTKDLAGGHFEYLNVLDHHALRKMIAAHKVTQVYNLAAVLSASGEKKPKFAWNLNMKGLLNVLEIAREKHLERIFWPSSIAVFGPHTPRDNTPQYTTTDPNTVYGISKLAGERWCAYYFEKYGVDVRSLRYPGLIGYKSFPGGGTTDYAVDIYHKALQGKPYDCFLKKDTYLPMMYMPDAIKATVDLMQATPSAIRVRDSYNISAVNFSPEEIVAAIKKHISSFEVRYKPDFRQAIADSWPNSIDDSAAREDWGWKNQYDLESMTKDILENLSKRASM